MATKRRRSSGSWEYIVKRAGVLPKPISLTFTTEEEGDPYVARLEALLDRGIVPEGLISAGTAIESIGAALKEYRAAVPVPASDEALLDVAAGRLGTVRLSMCDFAWAQSWVTAMKREQGLSPGTVRHYVGALARALDWVALRRPDVLPANPLRQLPRRYATYNTEDAKAFGVLRPGTQAPRDAPRDRRLGADEEARIRAILAGEKPKDRERAFELRRREDLVLLFDLALETAMRLRELFTLELAQVDLPRRTIFLDKTKNGSKRQVPLSSVAVSLLKGRLADAPGPRLFPWWDGKRESLEKTTSLLSRQFARIFDAAGCGDLNFHDLRHEATSRIFERTVLDPFKIAKITGHKDMRMLDRYANLRGSDLADQMW